ncbi:methylmalonate semialdehyde dehydrogenase [acylating] [Elysia marginata]|uniref:Methylmalonate semialdehyde dehydrogenase [acylating] n=1 Tax=Elysia marginata TaxID=1093978 RepID=A0AAV4I5G2_9GAST|nr:methylmalonate semialdehyde dehydrogenase [acylating] [Elysia marginata]
MALISAIRRLKLVGSSTGRFSRFYAASAPTTKMFINNEFVESKTNKWIDLHNPATNEVVTRVPESTQAEMEAAVAAARDAYPAWSSTTVLTRQQIMFKLQDLIKKNMDRLAANITQEQGKTLVDAVGDVTRGLQVVEHCCSITSLQLGETIAGISKDMDTFTFRLPLGVVAGITPFNFPAMIPLWMFPLAAVCGNTSILKPSERDPGATMILMELCQEAGMPPGVVNVIHGAHDEVVEHCCSITSLQLGETIAGISKDMDTFTFRLPLGVVAGITPFNFPAMIPLWMFPLAAVCGNTSILKPSERDPGATMILMELCQEAGMPPGVVNVIHGAHDAVNFICDAPDIQAISFVGSDQAVRTQKNFFNGSFRIKRCNLGLIECMSKV